MAAPSARSTSSRALGDEMAARYRDWVDGEPPGRPRATDGRVGYIHIPDMGSVGYRRVPSRFLAEYERDALIVDVRYNGGGTSRSCCSRS